MLFNNSAVRQMQVHESWSKVWHFNIFQKMANNLPEVKNLYRISLQTVMQCPLVTTGKNDLSVKQNVISLLPISLFSHLISMFLLLE